jgi:type IV pilus assembly protein PilP
MSTDMKLLHSASAAVVITLALVATPAMSAPQRGAASPAPSAAAAPPPATQSAPAQPPSAQPQPGQPQAAQVPPKPGDAAGPFTYNPEGRRDPFVSLIGKGSDPKSAGTRPPGVPGLLINEVSVKGIVRNSSGFVALIQGADSKTYVVKAGDRLLDGTVKSIVQDAVVFSQDVNDPLSLVKQKEIRKPLRSAEGGRG